MAAKAEELQAAFIAVFESPGLGVAYLGIDPGLTGAVAVLRGDRFAVIDIPTVKVPRSGGKMENRFDDGALLDLFKHVRRWCQESNGNGVVACLERAQVRIKGKITPVKLSKGGQFQVVRMAEVFTAFKTGLGFGMWPLYLMSIGVRVEEVAPASWKKAMGLAKVKGDSKEYARMRARQFWPAAPLTAKDHHNRAEALLLAEYLRRRHAGGPGVKPKRTKS